VRWLVIDRLYNAEAYDFGHLDSYGHFLAEAGEEVWRYDLAGHRQFPGEGEAGWDVVFALDGYEQALKVPARVHIAQVACDTVVPPGFSAVISSIPAMVDFYRQRGENAHFQALAFDTRALVCSMGVQGRDIQCLFVGTIGPNHVKRRRILASFGDFVTTAPPTFGKAMFRLLARAQIVVNVHAEWSRGVINNMRMYEAAGMQCRVLTDGVWPSEVIPDQRFGQVDFDRVLTMSPNQTTGELAARDQAVVLQNHTYIQRIPRLIELARSL